MSRTFRLQLHGKLKTRLRPCLYKKSLWPGEPEWLRALAVLGEDLGEDSTPSTPHGHLQPSITHDPGSALFLASADCIYVPVGKLLIHIEY